MASRARPFGKKAPDTKPWAGLTKQIRKAKRSAVAGLTLSPDQQKAIDVIEDWLDSAPKLYRREGPRGPSKQGARRITLGGYAGTGKTTLVRELLARHEASVCAFTGKAAYVLRSKGVSATTMHSLLYTPRYTADKVIFDRVDTLPHSLVIVDEASMIDKTLMADLESFPVNIIYVGDHGQLEPVGDDPGLMHDPDIRLEQIHRQASESPIIRFAHHVREGNAPVDFGDGARLVERATTEMLLSHDAVLCGYNRTRTDINRRMRLALGHEGPIPIVGERVICLRNHREYGVFNGMQATVVSVEQDKRRPDELVMVARDDIGATTVEMTCAAKQFGAETTLKDADYGLALWDWGYALTVHKSQGSEWPRVLVLEQIARDWSADRWRYTASTRAAQRLTYVQRSAQ